MRNKNYQTPIFLCKDRKGLSIFLISDTDNFGEWIWGENEFGEETL